MDKHSDCVLRNLEFGASLGSTVNTTQRSARCTTPGASPSTNMYQPDSLTEPSTFTSGGYPQAHVETHVSLATGATTDTDVGPESDAILLEFISPAILAGALGWVKRNPICGERKILKAHSTTFVKTRVQVSLTIWVDTLSAPAQGEMSIAMREEKSTGEKRFPDGSKILDIPVTCWTAPDEKAFHKRLDLIFAADGELMHDDVL